MGTLIAARAGRTEPLLDYATAGRALDGSPASGDAHLVLPTDAGVLLAAVDGLGHGAEAAMAARAALLTLQEHAGEPVAALLRHCHLAMQRTRGAAMAVAAIAADGTLSWAGIGNVEALVLRRRPGGGHEDLAINNLGGIVGYRMPRPHDSVASLAAGDLLVFATDGIKSGFAAGINRIAATETIAARILDDFARPSDDALVLIGRWLGGG